jgi:CheY-like chemotaxis protein
MHILIIEDDLLLALDLQDALAELGGRSVSFAATEDNAVRSAVGQKPDLIVSDVRLAEGIGTKAVQRIRESLGDIPVIYVTANPERALREDPGATVLSKPFRREDLAEAKSLVMRSAGLPAKSDA